MTKKIIRIHKINWKGEEAGFPKGGFEFLSNSSICDSASSGKNHKFNEK